MVLVLKKNFGITNFPLFYLKVLFAILMFMLISSVGAEDVRYSHDKALVSAFNIAFISLSKGEIAQAKEEIFELKAQASDLGYSELSEFSFRLLRSSRAYKGEPSEKKEIISMAENLSPNHPGVLLAISSSSGILSTLDQLTYLKRGLFNLSNYPLTSLSIISRFLTPIVLAGMLSAFVVLLIILISSASELVVLSGKLFSRKYKKSGGAIAFTAAIVVPGFLPLTLAMALWVLFLMLAMPRFWWLALSISIFSFYLEFALIPSVLLTSFTESSSSRALESIANNGFVPRIVDYVDDEISKESGSAVWYLILGQIFQSRGDDVRALENYENAKLNIGKEKSITYLMEFNKAVHSLQIGETEKAFTELMDLRTQGWKQFEILFNISLASTILHKSEVYDEVFKEMQAVYPEQLELVLEKQGESPAPILGRLPNNFFIELVSFNLGRILKLSKASFNPTGYLKMSLLGGVFLLAVYFSSKKNILRYSRTFVNQRLFMDVRKNKFWNFIPLGWAIREGRLFVLYLYLSSFVLLVLLLNGQPVKLFIESEKGVTSLAPLLAILICGSYKSFRRSVDNA